MKDRLARSVFWLVWSRGAVQAISIVSMLVVARLVTPADFGLVAVAGMFTWIVAMIGELGLGAAIIQFRDLDEADVTACFWLVVALTVAGYIVLYVLAPVFAVWFGMPRLTVVLRVSALVIPLTGFAVIPDALLRHRIALDRISQVELAAIVVRVPVVVVLAWRGANVWALVAGALVQPAVHGVLVYWLTRWRPRLRFRSSRFGAVLRFSLATFGARVCWAVYQQADTFVLGKFGGDVVVGLYSMARNIAGLPVSKISTVVNQLAAPVMAELQADRSLLAATHLRALRLVLMISVPVCGMLAIVSDDFVTVLLGPRWTASVDLIRVLSLHSLLFAVGTLFPPVLLSRYRAGLVLRYDVVRLLLFPPLFLAGAWLWGPIGVAWAWVVGYPVVAALLLREVVRELDLRWSVVLDQCRVPVVAGLALVVSVIALREAWALLPDFSARWEHAVLRLGAATLTGVIVYGGVVWAIGPRERREFLEVAGWILRRGHAGQTTVAPSA